MRHVLKSMMAATALVMVFLTACSSNPGSSSPADGSAAQGSEPPSTQTSAPQGDAVSYTGDPVTLKIMYGASAEWWELIRKSIEDKFPNIKVEQTEQRYNSKHLEELFAKGESLDLFVGQDYELAKSYDLIEPIDEKIATANYDLSIYRDGIIDILRSRDPEGNNQLYGLPISEKMYGLFYNKTIFDKFGVDYPKDGLTIDQTFELAQKVTGERDGIKYKGLTIPFYSFLFSQLGASGTDPQTGEVLFSKDPAFKKYFEMIQKYKNIPGMIDTSDAKYNFDEEQNIAMTIMPIELIEPYTNVEGLNFDLVTVPVWADHPNVAPTAPPININVSKHSKHKDAAWAVMAYLASEEGQLVRSRDGFVPVVKDQETIAQFGATQLDKTGKTFNLAAPFTQDKAKLPPYSVYGPQVLYSSPNFIDNSTDEFIESNKDIVSFLREMDEKYAAEIKEQIEKN